MNANEIRRRFLEFFERRGHKIVKSSPLLPANDPTLLFTNAGMNQFKDVFLGLEERDYKRAVTSQKCIRAGGKHNDLDQVGRTARHHTFFEMLGNFSFGDYFKGEAIEFAWDLLTNEYKLEPARLWVTIFEGDEEVGADEDAALEWERVGVARERILRFGRKDNFWQMGETGPCGPCTEIHYYLGENPEDPDFNRAEFVNGPGDTTVEIWNLVFMQYNRIGDGESPGGDEQKGPHQSYRLEPLPSPSVDTGGGLERFALALQGVKSVYDTDLLRPIVEYVAKISGTEYGSDPKADFAVKVIADHARATAFSIADNILPGNEGRNYVLRKIMRRAIYHGRHALGFREPFFHKAADFVVDHFREAYPELEGARDFIGRMVRLEEERFGSTLSVGLKRLEDLLSAEENVELVNHLRATFREADGGTGLESNKEFQDLFKKIAPLNDTYGLPRDLIRVGLEDRGLEIPEEVFNHWFNFHIHALQQSDLRGAGTEAKVRDARWSGVEEEIGKPTEFIGYETTTSRDSKLLKVFPNTENPWEEAYDIRNGEHYLVILDKTPFYAESGGQVGDTGVLLHEKVRFVVNDTVGTSGGLVVHKVTAECDSDVSREELNGATVLAEVDAGRRDATRRNHTATHLMHAALREVLGSHVKQAGSVVAPNYLRFDFTHYQPLTRDEIAEVERLVNHHILRNDPVRTELLTLEEAMRSGAMALFGEKYAERVRVLSVPGADGVFSKELCGGTHVRATGDIGLFKITSDESIASGTRRIRAVTGVDALTRFQETEALVDTLSAEFRTTRGEIPAAVARLHDELKKARREAEELRLKLALGGGAAPANGQERREVEGVTVVAREASDLDAPALRQLSDTLLSQIKTGVVILGRRADGKASLIVRTSGDLVKRVPAGQVIKELTPIIGGRGGGRPDMAEGGGSEPQKLSEALQASYQIVEDMLRAGK